MVCLCEFQPNACFRLDSPNCEFSAYKHRNTGIGDEFCYSLAQGLKELKVI